MKKIINYAALLGMLFSFVGINAQNSATTSGNWNNCATWGNPLSIIQNTTDTKTIPTGVTVAQNTTWSTGGVTLNGTGAVTFASSANAVSFITDGGGDQSCCTVVTPSTFSVTQPSCTNGKIGQIVINTQSNVQYSINNGNGYQVATSFSNLAPGTYTLKVRSTLNTNCSSSTATVTLNDPGSCISPCTTPSGLAVSGAGTIAGCQSRSFVLTGSNISSASWAVSPTTGVTSATSGSGSTANLSFNSSAVGNYTVTFTASSTGSCTTTTALKSAVVTVNATGDATFTASGSSSNSLQTNAIHAGVSTCNVTVDAAGFLFNVSGSYTFTGTINMTSRSEHGNHKIMFNRGVGWLADNFGLTPFTFTITRNAGDRDNYFWMYTAADGGVAFTISDGVIHKN